MSNSSPEVTHSVKAGLRSAVKDTWSATKDAVRDKFGQVTRHLREGKETVQDKASEVTRQAKSLTGQTRVQVPEPVVGRIDQLAKAVRQRPVPAASMVVAVLALLLVGRLIRTTR
jgi:hypothetical protein